LSIVHDQSHGPNHKRAALALQAHLVLEETRSVRYIQIMVESDKLENVGSTRNSLRY